MKEKDDKILLAQVSDKIEMCENKNKIEYTDFLDLAQIELVQNYINKLKIENYIREAVWVYIQTASFFILLINFPAGLFLYLSFFHSSQINLQRAGRNLYFAEGYTQRSD